MSNTRSSIEEKLPLASPVSERARVTHLRRLLGHQLSRFGGLYIWAGLILLFGLWLPQTFLTAATAQGIAGDQAITVVLALGLIFALAAGAYDLSIAQNLGFSAVLVSALMVKSDVAPVLAVVLTLGAGLTIGIVNGVLVAGIGVNSFIATLGTSSVLLALTELLSKQQFIGPNPMGFQSLTSGKVAGIPVITGYALVAAVIAWYVLEHSPIGRRLQATGANPDATRLAGVVTGRYVFCSLVVSGVVGSLAGILVASRISTVSPDLGLPYLLPAFAACFLSTTQFKLGRFNVWGTVLALYLLGTGVTGLQLAGAQSWVTNLFYGLALILAVAVAVIGQKRRSAADG